MGRHRTGEDLTADMAAAPHGEEVLARVTELGPVAGEGGKSQPPDRAPDRVSIALAWTGLACAVPIVACLAWWNWGPSLVNPSMGG